MPKQRNGGQAPDFQRLRAILLDTRRELIDLSRRNRLLHAPRTGKRPHCLEILNADPDEVFVGLTQTGRQFVFAPIPDNDQIPHEVERAQNGRLQSLQTNLAQEPLNRRLLKFFREARTFEEEQGVNILFLALGILNWYEDDRSEERCSAPLLLVPVSLERRQGRHLFVMRGRDDDMIVNVSLAERLRGLGVTLPDLPDNDEWRPSAYFDAVATATAGQNRWEVDRVAIGLGFFTFSKFLMWRDLDPAVWPELNTLIQNELIKNLLGEDPAGEPAPPLASDDEPIDHHIDLASAIHVLDADSSQALCIEEARRGQSLVVQGPPGTGKSQSIANVIASAAYDGKSVLFVAEKAAALDVVFGRLKSVGLEPLCLELHSRKATKQSVITSLGRSILAAGAAQPDGRTATDLRKARDSLNEWSRTLHREIRRSGRTPYQLMGTVLKLHAAGVRVLDERLDVAADWDRDRLGQAERAVERAASAVRHLGGAPIRHPWYGTSGNRLTPFDSERLQTALNAALHKAKGLDEVGNEATALLGYTQETSCARLVDFAEALRLLSRAPKCGRETLHHAGWRSERQRIQQLVGHGNLWSSAVAEIGNHVVSAAWTAEVGAARHAIAAHGRSLFRWLVGRYRRAIADLRGLCQGPPPRRFQDRLSLLDTLIAAQAARRKLEEEREFGRAILGSIWASESTSWTVVEHLLTWVNEADQWAATLNLVGLAVSADDSSCTALSTKLEAMIASFRAALGKVAEIICLDAKALFGVTEIEHAPLSAVIDRLEHWVTELHVFNDWVAARDALAALDAWGMQLIGEELKAGSIDASEVKPMTDLLIAEALWRSALSDDPTLDQIDGAHRSEIVADFRALDCRRIELARSEVLARYVERKPMGVAGEMAIVRAEIGKKRRHLPVRKLFERAGSAVQRLKPIFLMSPLSVAQFLPPGRFTFDLVIIDEASQVPPEEALGVIARARQMLVVGDDKQLPPTNFFRMLSTDDDDENDDEMITSSVRARNFESILTLARARGFGERMLRWHYRSRHPSLIALSNHSCYAGGLLLPPSPLIEADDLGLSLIKTPRGHYDRGGSGRNPVEADIIAAAVERHLQGRPTRSLGIACFSVAQRDAIEDALQTHGLLAAAEAFAPHGERLFIKNLEAVQGDERDVIFISIGYGPDAYGRMTAGFGPLSADGGERRLNVLISRARFQCVVFSSITAGDIPIDVRARGTRMLREFLHFAEFGHISAGAVDPADYDSPFEEAVAIAIIRGGYKVVPQVGVSGFRVDLGVLHPREPGRFVLGVECDGAAYHSGRSARDRDRLRQEVLEGLGWKLHRVWSTDWFRNPKRETQRLLTAILQACLSNADAASATNSEPAENPEPAVELPSPTADIRAEPPSAAPLAEPYEECKLPMRRGSDLFSTGYEELSELAAIVVRHEGPIHLEEVARRIREAFGLERTGHRILNRVSAALQRAARQGTVKQDGEFWSSKSAPLTAPRSRRNSSISLRRPDRIAPAEYRLAISAVLRSCVAASKAELTAGVARALGFDRTGNDLDRAISDQIDLMIAAGEIDDMADRLELRRNPR